MELTQPASIASAVNEVFANIDEGFVNKDNEPAMTTPATFYAVQYAVVGSTVCLVC